MSTARPTAYQTQTMLSKFYQRFCDLFYNRDHFSRDEIQQEVTHLINSLHEEADLHLYQQLGQPTRGEVIRVDFINGRKHG